jgi:hypothetical protein
MHRSTRPMSAAAVVTAVPVRYCDAPALLLTLYAMLLLLLFSGAEQSLQCLA